ncbi:hypothetical protein ACHAW6_014643 [Cyclotella cf. meneghiniana]
MASPSTHLYVNMPSKKLTGWVIGLLHRVQNPGRKTLMPSSIWIVPGL